MPTLLTLCISKNSIPQGGRDWRGWGEARKCCYILILHHFSVHTRGIHKWNTNLCMSTGLHSTSFKMYYAAQRAYRNGVNVYICTCGVVEHHASEYVTVSNIQPFYSLVTQSVKFTNAMHGTQCGHNWMSPSPIQCINMIATLAAIHSSFS